MRNLFKSLSLVLVSLFTISTAIAGDCEYSKKVSRSLDLNGVKQIRVDAGAGGLDITGVEGLDEIVIDAKVCASEQSLLDASDIEQKITAGRAEIYTEIAKDSSSWNWSSEYAYIDLELKVPANAVLEVRDSSGEATVKNVAELNMKDSSGELTIADIAGNLTVTDSSGALNINDIGGEVEVTDSSGGIYISDVKQGVLVVADSSGSIEAKRIGRDVHVRADSSGSISVKDVGGDFRVDRDSSGAINYKRVAGKVSLPENKRS